MRLRLAWLAGSIVFITLCTGCGTPGAPQLPSLQLARPVEDLTGVRKGNRVQLDWTLPKKNTDKTQVKFIPQARICRNEGSALMSSCTEVAKIPVPNPEPPKKQKGEPEPKPERMQYVDILPERMEEHDPSGFVAYAVEMLNRHGRSAGLSNQVFIPLAPTLPAPDEVSAAVSAEGVTVSWSGAEPPKAPAGVTYQYRIMRSPAGSPAYVAVSDVEPSASGSYLDKTFAWEQKYDYRITTVTLVHSQGHDASVDGDDSKPTEVFTKDIYPPSQPVGLQAVFSSVGQKPFVDLSWAPNTEGDVAGYNVFRRIKGGQFAKLNTQLVSVPSFRDSNTEAGKTYIYSVSAVDQRGNESPRSAEATETAPDKQ